MNKLLNNLEKLFSSFSKDYRLIEQNFDNPIQFRRLQNAIQQVSEYKTSIKELLDDRFTSGKQPSIDNFDTLLKLFFEYVAVTDTILRYSENFLSGNVKGIKILIEEIAEEIYNSAKENPSAAEEEYILKHMYIIIEDTKSLLNYWGK